MFETIIIQKVVPLLAVALAGLAVKFLSGLLAEQKKTAARKEAIEALEAGVAHVANEFVDAAKEAAKDGKLTKDEIERARMLAQNRAIEVVTSPEAAELIIGWSWNIVTGLIDMLVGKKKKE